MLRRGLVPLLMRRLSLSMRTDGGCRRPVLHAKQLGRRRLRRSGLLGRHAEHRARRLTQALHRLERLLLMVYLRRLFRRW